MKDTPDGNMLNHRPGVWCHDIYLSDTCNKGVTDFVPKVFRGREIFSQDIHSFKWSLLNSFIML
jgi:hypothetical protein